MVDKNPMLLVDTPNGQTKIELGKVVNVGDEHEKKPTVDLKAIQNAEKKSQPESPEPPFEGEWPRTAGMDSSIGWMGGRP
jgi:hypothetical protein